MVLKLDTNGTQCFFEGHYIQVTLVKKESAKEVYELPFTFQTIQEEFGDVYIAHINRNDKTDSVMFDCAGYLMENGKTLERFPALRKKH